MAQVDIDAELEDWSEIQKEFAKGALLVGNGLSINVWNGFRYDSLYAEAPAMPDADRKLFEALGTENFERVLADLGTSMRVLAALGTPTGHLLTRYRSVQRALGEAIRAVHIDWNIVPDGTLAAIQDELHRYEWVFTTNYDLLLYWAMGHGDNYRRLVDCFWGPKCSFDPDDITIRPNRVPVFFLHGAMHLVVESSGRTRKLTRGNSRLLDQFGKPIGGDPGARALLVTEGSWQDKLQAIESNRYLASVFATLRSRALDIPLVIFGAGLAEQDRHLIDAINDHPEAPVAVSIRPSVSRAVIEEKHRILRLLTRRVVFYDSSSHPLGAKALHVALPSAEAA